MSSCRVTPSTTFSTASPAMPVKQRPCACSTLRSPGRRSRSTWSQGSGRIRVVSSNHAPDRLRPGYGRCSPPHSNHWSPKSPPRRRTPARTRPARSRPWPDCPATGRRPYRHRCGHRLNAGRSSPASRSWSRMPSPALVTCRPRSSATCFTRPWNASSPTVSNNGPMPDGHARRPCARAFGAWACPKIKSTSQQRESAT